MVMISSFSKLEDAETGRAVQSFAKNLDVLPSIGEGVEFLGAFECDSVGPNETFGYPGPKWNGQIFSKRSEGTESRTTQLLDGEDLEREVAECARYLERFERRYGLFHLLAQSSTSLSALRCSAGGS